MTHCTLLCISASFLHVPHFLQSRVKFFRREVIGIVQQVWKEFFVGFGVDSISYTFECFSQRRQCGGGKSSKLGLRDTWVLSWAWTLSYTLALSSHIE